VKNKHAANGSGIKNSKSQRAGPADGIVKAKSKGQLKKSTTPTSLSQLNKKKKKKVYTEKELGIPQLNMITPVGVEKPKGKKKGKVFVDDRVCCFPDNVARLILSNNCLAGEHEHDSRHGASGKGGPN
jgi:60S ribosomal subunit assembly/export protein LOC1